MSEQSPRTMGHATVVVMAIGALCLGTHWAAAESPKADLAVHVMDAAEPCSPDRCAANASFSAREVLDLEFRVVLHPRFRQAGELRVSVHCPDGHLYRKIVVPVTSGKPSKGGRDIPGYARPVAEQQLEEHLEKGGAWYLSTDVMFPVAATDIVSRGIYGRWSVHVELTHKRLTVTADRDFELTP